MLLPFNVSNLFASIQVFHRALDYHLERQNMLASNIAHVDTPGYVPKDIERASAGGFADALEMAVNRTQATHMVGAEAAAVTTGRVYEDPAAGASSDLNYVSLDREAAKLAANQLRYDAISTITTAKFEGIALAANDGRG